MTTAAQALEQHLTTQLQELLFGMEDVIHGLALAVIGRGHALLEGPPGVGKTRLTKAFAQTLGGDFRRIQGTADLMPSDVTGVHVFNSASEIFEFQPGPLFADVLLVDEINRAGPKTQSALLQAMEERQVTVDLKTFSLPDDFLLIATMNPREFEGTFPLPESQLDRFALALPVTHVDRETETEVLKRYCLPTPAFDDSVLKPVAPELLARAREELNQVHVSDELFSYILDIAHATRDSTSVNLGLSTRGALNVARFARIEASLRGGDFVIPDDVQRVAPWVVPHRLALSAEQAISGVTAMQFFARLLEELPVPR